MSLKLLCFLPLLFLFCEGHERRTTDEYMNICMDGKHHKYKAGPEGSLFKQCTPWSKHSCCRGNVSKAIHTTDDWYNFSWHHCGRLSQQCHSHFIQDLCFYECTPNGGPWIVQDSGMKMRKERYFNIPLCADECNNWWNSCKDDRTCIENWTRGFDWATGKNECPKSTQCRKFSEVFKSAEDFCEKVWDHSYKVASKGEPCFKLWFDEGENPNSIVALQKAGELVSGSQNIRFEFLFIVVSLLTIYINIGIRSIY